MVLWSEAKRFDDEEHDIGLARRLADAAVERLMQHTLEAGRVARRIDEYVLAVRARQDARDQMAGCLRPGGDDRELLPHQAVQQARLPGVRAPNQRHGAAMMVHVPSFFRISRAASCSARWRELPVPCAVTASAVHSTSNDWRCAAPCTAVTRYTGNGRCAACSLSCSSVFASFAARSGSSASSRAPKALSAAALAAS